MNSKYMEPLVPIDLDVHLKHASLLALSVGEIVIAPAEDRKPRQCHIPILPAAKSAVTSETPGICRECFCNLSGLIEDPGTFRRVDNLLQANNLSLQLFNHRI